MRCMTCISQRHQTRALQWRKDGLLLVCRRYVVPLAPNEQRWRRDPAEIWSELCLSKGRPCAPPDPGRNGQAFSHEYVEHLLGNRASERAPLKHFCEGGTNRIREGQDRAFAKGHKVGIPTECSEASYEHEPNHFVREVEGKAQSH